MLIYFLVFIALLVLAIMEVYFKKVDKKTFMRVFSAITLMAAIRFGVGSDYFNYLNIYKHVPRLNDPGFIGAEVHGELGFTYIQGFFKLFYLDYYVFTFVITLVMMGLFYHYITKYSKSYMLSLLIFYSMYYFSYVNSAVRQGLSLGIFAAVLIPLLLKRKYVHYVIVVLLAALLHSSILVALVLPLFIFKLNKRNVIALLGLAFAVSFFDIGILLKPFGRLYDVYLIYFGTGISVLAVLSRLVIAAIVFALYYFVKDRASEETKQLLRFYFLGLLLYIVLVRSTVLSSRLQVYFKSLEIILLPNLIYLLKEKQRKLIAAVAISLVMSVMWVKEINAALYQGDYFVQNTYVRLPYVTVFNKKDIKDIRFIPYKIKKLINFKSYF